MAKEQNDLRFYVYALYVEGEDTPFYIGKGSGNRLNEHTMPSRMKASSKTIRAHKIRKAISEGKKVIAEKLIENLTESEAFSEEVRCIESYGRRDNGTGCLANHSNGGEGASGSRKPKSEAHRAAISAALKGKSKSDEHRKKLSASLVGHTRSEESKQKQAETMSASGAVNRCALARSESGYKHSPKTIEKIRKSQLRRCATTNLS